MCAQTCACVESGSRLLQSPPPWYFEAVSLSDLARLVGLRALRDASISPLQCWDHRQMVPHLGFLYGVEAPTPQVPLVMQRAFSWLSHLPSCIILYFPVGSCFCIRGLGRYSSLTLEMIQWTAVHVLRFEFCSLWQQELFISHCSCLERWASVCAYHGCYLFILTKVRWIIVTEVIVSTGPGPKSMRHHRDGCHWALDSLLVV